MQRLKKQILETKSCLKNKTKENTAVPLVICGNKCDRELYREVKDEEIEQLVGGDENCAYFEISAKRNANVDQMFSKLFTMAKLPSEMSPDRHRKVSVQYCDVLHRKSFRNKKLKNGDAYGIVAPFARRPSVQSDLMYIREKAVGGAQSKDRCAICWTPDLDRGVKNTKKRQSQVMSWEDSTWAPRSEWTKLLAMFAVTEGDKGEVVMVS